MNKVLAVVLVSLLCAPSCSKEPASTESPRPEREPPKLADVKPAVASQTEALPCPEPATEAALIAVAHGGASDARVIEWMTTCGVPFPVGGDGLERLIEAGVSPRVAGAAAVGRYFYLVSNPSDELIAQILANMQPGAIARPFSGEDKAKVVATVGTPMVTAIRTLLNRYQSKELMTDGDDQSLVRLLDALPSDVLTSRFSLLAAIPHPVGGEVVTIMLTDPSHLVLDVHVMDGVVSFLREKPLSSEVRERLAHYYRFLLEDAEYLR